MPWLALELAGALGAEVGVLELSVPAFTSTLPVMSTSFVGFLSDHNRCRISLLAGSYVRSTTAWFVIVIVPAWATWVPA